MPYSQLSLKTRLTHLLNWDDDRRKVAFFAASIAVLIMGSLILLMKYHEFNNNSELFLYKLVVSAGFLTVCIGAYERSLPRTVSTSDGSTIPRISDILTIGCIFATIAITAFLCIPKDRVEKAVSITSSGGVSVSRSILATDELAIALMYQDNGAYPQAKAFPITKHFPEDLHLIYPGPYYFNYTPTNAFGHPMLYTSTGKESYRIDDPDTYSAGDLASVPRADGKGLCGSACTRIRFELQRYDENNGIVGY